ncbi:MAG: signal peptide protein [Rhodobacter sp. CACIA14H1]|nr:MAG: signal peptide protein [Rhodobacter sp. CACIA14H1]
MAGMAGLRLGLQAGVWRGGPVCDWRLRGRAEGRDGPAGGWCGAARRGIAWPPAGKDAPPQIWKGSKMIRKIAVAALALPMLTSSVALAEEEGKVDAAVQEKLTAQLVAEGYEVRQFKSEDGLIEVYVVKDGKMQELWFDADLKQVEHEED